MDPKNRKSVLPEIPNRLHFFAMSLLAVEGIIGAVVATSKMPAGFVFASICIMAALFLALVSAVAFIAMSAA